MEVTEIFCNFRVVLEGKTGKEIPKSSRLEFLEKFLVNNFALSDAEDDTSRLLNRGGVADLLLLRTLEPRAKFLGSDGHVIVSLAYASLAVSRTLWQRLLACLNFPLDSEDLLCWCKQKK